MLAASTFCICSQGSCANLAENQRLGPFLPISESQHSTAGWYGGRDFLVTDASLGCCCKWKWWDGCGGLLRLLLVDASTQNC
jgi:hypothetical protein